MNLGFTQEDDRASVVENRRLFVEAITSDPDSPLRTVRQIHSNRSVLISSEGEQPTEADGMITDRPGILLGILTADCVPVLVADPRRRVVGAFHAGWRGTVERILEHGIQRMVKEFGSDPAEIIAAIGPCIRGCCYSVGDEVMTRFEANFSYGAELFSLRQESPEGRTQSLDLVEANRRQLIAAGVSAGSISVVGGCTSCEMDRYFSHRASGGRAGRMMAVIGIR